MAEAEFFRRYTYGYYSEGYDAYATDCADLRTKVCPINFERNSIYRNSSVCCSIFNSECCSLDPRDDMPRCTGDQSVEDQCNLGDCTGLPDKRACNFGANLPGPCMFQGHRRSSFAQGCAAVFSDRNKDIFVQRNQFYDREPGGCYETEPAQEVENFDRLGRFVCSDWDGHWRLCPEKTTDQTCGLGGRTLAE